MRFTCTLLLLLLSAILAAAQPYLPDTVRISSYRFFDAPIDPDRYLMRPADQLLVTFIGAQLSPISLRVNPEGRVVHPTLGVFDFRQATLSTARVQLRQALSELYRVDSIDISVVAPQLVAVQVSGAVESPGLYLAYTSQRVSEVIDSAGGVRPTGSRRYIRLFGGPEEIRVDLDRAALGDEEWNPPLYAGHTVVVPAKSFRQVNVVGQVDRPRDIEVDEGETVADILPLVGPLRATADSAGIQIIRGSVRLAAPDTPLEPGDMVFVPPLPGLLADAPVTVFGAVNQPGRYELNDSPLLSEVLVQAGGLTPTAAAAELTVFRLIPLEASLRAGERYAIANLVLPDGSLQPFTLQPGDSVFVPLAVGYVKVTGEVRNPGMFPYNPGSVAKDYIAAAGGFLPRADRQVIEIFHRIARLTEEHPVGVQVHDGDEVIVRLREEFR